MISLGILNLLAFGTRDSRIRDLHMMVTTHAAYSSKYLT